MPHLASRPTSIPALNKSMRWCVRSMVKSCVKTMAVQATSLHSKTQVTGRLGMSGGISPRHAQNPLSGDRRKTLSITHHALSPPPSHHHLYIIHLINWLQRFNRIIMSLKRPFVPKSDVKQWFTTTTTHHFFVLLNIYIHFSWAVIPTNNQNNCFTFLPCSLTFFGY